MNRELVAIHAGLMAPIPWLSPKFFYDEIGSRLFEDITHLPEYYLARTEKTIFEQARFQLVELVGTGSAMIDLGAGNCENAERLFQALRPSHCVAIDVASDFLAATLERIRADYPTISVQQIDGDFTHGLSLPSHIPSENRFIFFPG
jgi:uncharacterized SAM-dependent methyltransferase